MTHQGTGHGELLPDEGPAIPAPSAPARWGAAARTLAGVRRVPVARLLTAGPVLRASAYAVAAAVVGRVIRRVATAGRPVRAQPVSRGLPSPAGGADVRVTTWTAVEIRWRAD